MSSKSYAEEFTVEVACQVTDRGYSVAHVAS